MTCYDDAAFTTVNAGSYPNGNGCSFNVAGLYGEGNFTTKDIYVSFSGRPVYDDGTDFESAQAQRIGYITLTVSLPDAT